MEYQTPVNRWKALIALLLAMCYLPATAHCLLEQAGWFADSDGCCEDSTPTEDSSSNPPSCVGGCCGIERDNYSTTSRNPALVFFPAELATSTLLVSSDELPPAKILPIDTSPPDLPQAWQFSFRTALPPRAPSLVS